MIGNSNYETVSSPSPSRSRVIPILHHLGPFSGKKEFSQKNLVPPVLSTYGPSTSCKIWDKSNEPILRKNAAIMDEQIIWPFGAFWTVFTKARHFSKKFDSVSFEYLWPLNCTQNIKKLMSQSQKSCRNGWTHKSGHSGSSLCFQASISRKNSVLSVLGYLQAKSQKKIK